MRFGLPDWEEDPRLRIRSTAPSPFSSYITINEDDNFVYMLQSTGFSSLGHAGFYRLPREIIFSLGFTPLPATAKAAGRFSLSPGFCLFYRYCNSSWPFITISMPSASHLNPRRGEAEKPSNILREDAQNQVPVTSSTKRKRKDSARPASPERAALHDPMVDVRKLHHLEAGLLHALTDHALAARETTKRTLEGKAKLLNVSKLQITAEKAANLDSPLPKGTARSATSDQYMPLSIADFPDDMLGKLSDMCNGQLEAYYSSLEAGVKEELLAYKHQISEQEKVIQRYETRTAEDTRKVSD